MDALMKVMGPISERIYKEASQQQGPNPGAGAGPEQPRQQSQEGAQGDFVDADYKIVDDE